MLYVPVVAHEVRADFRDDIRIAWLIVLHCARGDAVLCTPFELASYEVLGKHPDKVWPAIERNREALLGPAASPKKSVQSVHQERKAA